MPGGVLAPTLLVTAKGRYRAGQGRRGGGHVLMLAVTVPAHRPALAATQVVLMCRFSPPSATPSPAGPCCCTVSAGARAGAQGQQRVPPASHTTIPCIA